MLRSAAKRPEKFAMYWKETARQMNDIGIGSLLIVSLIAVFIGAVAAVQFAYQLDGQMIPRFYIGYIVRDLAIIELAPTITALVLAGKVGSNIAAEIGGMRQKEHIDAMEVMGVNTAAYLITPKVIAAMIVIPMLVVFAAAVAIGGGYLATVPTGEITDDEYIRGLRVYFNEINVYAMYIKSVVFAFLLTTISAFQGYYVRGGSIELGQASTRAVVYSDIMILTSDYIIAVLITS
jgi:phospholipid/cholesterol/gamma-HCH transport system permease protein